MSAAVPLWLLMRQCIVETQRKIIRAHLLPRWRDAVNDNARSA